MVNRLPVGLSEATIRAISATHKEPDWMLANRLRAYQVFLSMPLPKFGPDLSGIDFNALSYYAADTNSPSNRWDELPAQIKETYRQIGLPQAEQIYLAGAQAQENSATVYQHLRDQWQKQGIIFTDTNTALRQYPKLFQRYFGSVVSYYDNKMAALNTAVWSGGSFIYLPPGVRLPQPLQAYFRIAVANVGQFERTLIIADHNSSLQYIEGCSAPVYSTESLHAAVVEVVAKPHARVRYTTIQNWSTNVFNLTTQRMRVEANAVGEWIDGNIGSKVTMKYPAVVLTGPGARGNIISLASATTGQTQDSGGRAIHLSPHTSSTIVSKSLSSGSGQCNYRSQVVISPNATQASSATSCDALLLDRLSSSQTFPSSTIGQAEATVSHEATVGQIDSTQLFYLMSRGLSRDEATELIIGGFIEPITRNLPMEYAVELNRLIELNMKDAVG